MKYNIFLLLAFSLFFSSCVSDCVKPHIKAADQITKPYIKNSCKQNNLQILGTGGKMMYDIEEIYVGFIAYDELTIEEARKHYLKVVIPFVESIKCSEEVTKYLHYPDQVEKAVNISITYRNKLHKQPSPPKIAHVSMIKGIIFYSVDDAYNLPYRTVYEETYQEALSKINLKTN